MCLSRKEGIGSIYTAYIWHNSVLSTLLQVLQHHSRNISKSFSAADEERFASTASNRLCIPSSSGPLSYFRFTPLRRAFRMVLGRMFLSEMVFRCRVNWTRNITCNHFTNTYTQISEQCLHIRRKCPRNRALNTKQGAFYCLDWDVPDLRVNRILQVATWLSSMWTCPVRLLQSIFKFARVKRSLRLQFHEMF